MAGWTDRYNYQLTYQVERSRVFEESTPIFKCLKNMCWNQHWRNYTNISVVEQSVLKLMNYVFYLILRSPNFYYENPDRYIRMQPVSICTVPVDKIPTFFHPYSPTSHILCHPPPPLKTRWQCANPFLSIISHKVSYMRVQMLIHNVKEILLISHEIMFISVNWHWIKKYCNDTPSTPCTLTSNQLEWNALVFVLHTLPTVIADSWDCSQLRHVKYPWYSNAIGRSV